MESKTTLIKLISDNGAAEWELEYSHARKLLRAFGRIYSLPEDSEWVFEGGELKKKTVKKSSK